MSFGSFCPITTTRFLIFFNRSESGLEGLQVRQSRFLLFAESWSQIRSIGESVGIWLSFRKLVNGCFFLSRNHWIGASVPGSYCCTAARVIVSSSLILRRVRSKGGN